MKWFLNRSFWWPIIYPVVLAGFTAFVVLDAFFIPHAIRTMPDAAYAQSDNTTRQTVADVDVVQGNDAAAQATSDADAVQGNDSTGSATSGNATAAVYTANSYADANISIAITTERAYDTRVYIADIQIRSIEYLKAAFAQNTYGRNIYQTTSAMAESHDAIFAINGDQYGYCNSGFVIRNGILYRSSSSGGEALVICEDGSFEVVSESTSDADALLEEGAVQVFSFGPLLLSDGEINIGTDYVRNPRTAIGIISPLHYVVIVTDGRTDDSAGLTLYQLATVFKEQGCEMAYNLDGGGSSTMWFNGEVVNVPTDGRTQGERRVSDIVYVGY